MKINKYRKSPIYRAVGFLHATKGRYAVLTGQSSWRTVSGIFINTDKTGMLCIQFRRCI